MLSDEQHKAAESLGESKRCEKKQINKYLNFVLFMMHMKTGGYETSIVRLTHGPSSYRGFSSENICLNGLTLSSP